MSGKELLLNDRLVNEVARWVNYLDHPIHHSGNLPLREMTDDWKATARTATSCSNMLPVKHRNNHVTTNVNVTTHRPMAIDDPVARASVSLFCLTGKLFARCLCVYDASAFQTKLIK